LRSERKPPLNVRAVQRLYHSRQGDYLAKDDVSISKQVGVVSRCNGNFIDWLQARVFKTAGLDTSRWRKATYDDANQSPPLFARRRPALGTEKNPVVLPPHIQFIDSRCRPVEASFHLHHRDRSDYLVDLNDTAKTVPGEPVQQEWAGLCAAGQGRKCCRRHCPRAAR